MKDKKLPNPPEADTYEKFDACSSTECTGLMVVPPQTEEELESYRDIYEFEVSIDDVK